MIVKTYKHGETNVLVAYDENEHMVYIEGAKIASILNYDYPEVAVVKYLGPETYTPLKLNRADEMIYLVIHSDNTPEEITGICSWIDYICNDIAGLNL